MNRATAERHPWLPGVAGGLIGALVGLVVSAALYGWLVPILEASTGWVRELQGFAWNLVPLLTVAGFVVGVVTASRRRRPR